MSDNEKTTAYLLLGIFLILSIFLFPKAPALLESRADPFIVKKIKIDWNGRAKYYGKIQNAYLWSPKPIVLKTGRYTIGDTIYFTPKITE